MADSIRERIIQECEYQLTQLTTANGYNTNAGAKQERARVSWEENDAPCMSIFPQSESAERTQYRTEKMTMPFKIDIVDTYATTDTASKHGERVLADLRESMNKILKNPAGTLADDVVYASGGVQDFPEHSKRVVGVTATFNVIYQTKIGDPYKQ